MLIAEQPRQWGIGGRVDRLSGGTSGWMRMLMMGRRGRGRGWTIAGSGRTSGDGGWTWRETRGERKCASEIRRGRRRRRMHPRGSQLPVRTPSIGVRFVVSTESRVASQSRLRLTLARLPSSVGRQLVSPGRGLSADGCHSPSEVNGTRQGVVGGWKDSHSGSSQFQRRNEALGWMRADARASG